MIDMGTTAAVDTSQVNHTPEHSDAGVRALQESGLRVVYAYSRGAGDRAQYPQDLMRLRKTYFSSDDQLLTLALGGNLDARQFTFARKHGVRMVSHGVSDNTENTLLELGSAKLLRPGRRIHPLHASEQRRLAPAQGHRRPGLARGPDRDGDGPRHAADPGGARPWHAALR